MQLRIASLTLLCLALLAVPAAAQINLYDNGPGNDDTNAWTINFGYIVSDTFYLNCLNTCVVSGFSFNVWVDPGDDKLTSVDWSITSGENSGTVYGSATANGTYLTSRFVSTNAYGYDILVVTAQIPDTDLHSGPYWLNLFNAVLPSGDPVYWDENSGDPLFGGGFGCGGSNGHGANCPSMASENQVGTIASEAFTITGSPCLPPSGPSGKTSCGNTPEPGSIMLFASGILALAGMLRRKLF